MEMSIELKSLQNKEQQYKRTIKDLKDIIQKKDSVISSLEGEIKDLQNINNDLIAKVVVLEDEMESMR